MWTVRKEYIEDILADVASSKVAAVTTRVLPVDIVWLFWRCEYLVLLLL